MKNIYSYFIIFFLFPLIQIFSQEYKFEKITDKEGLSQNNIFDIFQDSRGFLWFAAPNGANRYDGYNFKVYRNDPFNSNSLSAGICTSINEDSERNIWIGTSKGLNKFQREINSFKYYSEKDGLSDYHISTLYKDRNDVMWIGMADYIGFSDLGGLAYFDKSSDSFISFVHDSLDETSISNNYVVTIYEDSKNNLWIGTANGLNKFDRVQQVFEKFFHDPENNNSISDNTTSAIFEDSNGDLWVGTNRGLNKFNFSSNSFERIEKGIEKKSLNQINITSIYESPTEKGFLWIGTNNGLYRYNLSSGKINYFYYKPEYKTGLPANEIKKIIEDHSGILWFATGSGVAKLNRYSPNFKNISTEILATNASESNVYSITQDAEGNILAGTSEGLVEVNLITGEKKLLKYYPHVSKNLSENHINTIYRDSRNRIWIGTRNDGIIRYDRDGNLLYQEKTDKTNISNNNISTVLEDKNRNIWIGTRGGGLNELDTSDLTFTRYYSEDKNSNEIERDVIISMFENGTDELWVGSTKGIRKFNIVEKRYVGFEHDSLFQKFIGNDIITCFAQFDKNKNILWVGTINRGLCRLNLNTGEVNRVTEQNSPLPSNTICGIISGYKDDIWISTKSGLIKYNPYSKNLRKYSIDDGLPANEFNVKSFYQDGNGIIYFGGVNGIVYFNPQNVKTNPFEPKLVIKDIKIYGESIRNKENKLFLDDLISTRQLKLNYDQNEITIEFAALHYGSPKHNQYLYKLDNYDEEEIFTTSERSVTYSHLSHGDYFFTLKAANSDGVWAEDLLELEIIIDPPLWKTWWAYTLYILLGLGFFQSYRKIELNRKLKSARLKESELRAETAEFQAKAAEAQARVIQAENERKTKELEEARALQLSMLPWEIPASENFEIAVHMKTATEVGGDYYDFVVADDGTLNVAIGDATGHGMQAGVVVALIKGLFVSDVADYNIKTFFQKSNKTIKSSRLGRMMMAFSLIKLKNNNVSISSAGMPPIYLYHNESDSVEEINLMGMPLGAMNDFPYKIVERELKQNDVLLMLSDGLPELQNENGEMFEYFRISKMLKDGSDKSAGEIIDEYIQAGEEWRQNKLPDDDITLIVIKLK